MRMFVCCFCELLYFASVNLADDPRLENHIFAVPRQCCPVRRSEIFRMLEGGDPSHDCSNPLYVNYSHKRGKFVI